MTSPSAHGSLGSTLVEATKQLGKICFYGGAVAYGTKSLAAKKLLVKLDSEIGWGCLAGEALVAAAHRIR